MRQAALGAATAIVLLVQDKADPNCVDSRGRTPLMYAAASGREASALALLRDCHADMRLKDNNGYDALLHAAMGGHTATVVLLVTFTKTEKKGSFAGLILAKAHARRLVQRYAGINGSLPGQAEGGQKPPCGKSASDIFTDLDSSLKLEWEQGEWGGGAENVFDRHDGLCEASGDGDAGDGGHGGEGKGVTGESAGDSKGILTTEQKVAVSAIAEAATFAHAQLQKAFARTQLQGLHTTSSSTSLMLPTGTTCGSISSTLTRPTASSLARCANKAAVGSEAQGGGGGEAFGASSDETMRLQRGREGWREREPICSPRGLHYCAKQPVLYLCVCICVFAFVTKLYVRMFSKSKYV
jgi:hypothetical protein